MTLLSIAIASEADRDELEAMIGACYAKSFRGHYDEALLDAALPMLRKIDTRLLNSGHYFKASFEGKLAGCGGWSAWRPGTAEEEAGLSHVRHFATHLDYMGRGVASALLERCAGEARNAGSTRMQCYSTIPSVGFYARHGFVKRNDFEIALADGLKFGAILMERAFAGTTD